jgi:hypothetical protein
MKYLKGLQYNNLNRTETKKLIYNDSTIISHYHKFKSEEEKEKRQQIIKSIIKEKE